MKRILIFAFAFLLAAVTLFTVTPRARAASPTVSASPASFSGTCPATINFSGVLYAAGAGTLKYYFSYYDPGQKKNIADPVKTVTPKFAGPVAVSDTGVMSGSGAGSVTLYEISPLVAQSAPFTIQVTCAAQASPAPNPRYRLQRPAFPIFRWNNVHFNEWDWRINHYESGMGIPEVGLACDTLCAGFRHITSGGGAPFGIHEIDDWRSYMQFAKFPAPVAQALLIFTTTDPQDVNCLEGAAPALATWQGNKDWVNGDFTYTVPRQVSGNTVTLDVTSIAQDWVSGKLPNHGFVIAGSDESGGGPDNITCIINFTVPPTLLVR